MSKYVITFTRLIEKKDENVQERVLEIFQKIGLKTALQVNWAGKINEDNSNFPNFMLRFRCIQVPVQAMICFVKSKIQ